VNYCNSRCPLCFPPGRAGRRGALGVRQRRPARPGPPRPLRRPGAGGAGASAERPPAGDAGDPAATGEPAGGRTDRGAVAELQRVAVGRGGRERGAAVRDAAIRDRRLAGGVAAAADRAGAARGVRRSRPAGGDGPASRCGLDAGADRRLPGRASEWRAIARGGVGDLGNAPGGIGVPALGPRW